MSSTRRPMLGNEAGSILLLTLVMIGALTLLGVALFELSTLEGYLVRGATSDSQGFYCGDSGLTLTKASLNDNIIIPPSTDGIWTRVTTTVGPGMTVNFPELGGQAGYSSPPSGGNAYTYSVTLVGVASGANVIVRCTDPRTGRTRTVEQGVQYTFLSPGYEYAAVGGGFNPATGIQDRTEAYKGTLVLGGTGAPVRIGGPVPYGRDTINGDVYMAGNVYLRGEAGITPFSTTDAKPTITLLDKTPPLTVTSTSTNFDPSVPGAVGSSPLNPMPEITNLAHTGVLDKIKAAVTNPDGTPKLTGTYNGATVYNLTALFDPTIGLGWTAEGNTERNLCRPGFSSSANCAPVAGVPLCTFGQTTTNLKCQIWQDLLPMGPKRSTVDPGPSDVPSYMFMGIPRAASLAPQSTGFSTIYYNLVNNSPELKQLGFDKGTGSNMGNLGSRLDTLAGPDVAGFGEGNVDRLVDFSIGVSAMGSTWAMAPRQPPIIFIDNGYFRADDGSNFAYNGIATVVTGKSAILSDNIIYLNGLANSNVTPPSNGAFSGCSGGGTTSASRSGCGAADVLGIVAKDDVWIGDAFGGFHTAAGIMLAGRDVNTLAYTSSSACCSGPSNPVTLNGSVMATRQLAMAHDWSDPQSNHQNSECPGAGGGCRPVMMFPTQPSNFTGSWCANPGISGGCWVYMKIDNVVGSPTYGALIPDSALAAFNGGCEGNPGAPLTCTAGARRLTHFQLNITYDSRIRDNAALIPPGLPAGVTGVITAPPTFTTWRDCGLNNPNCN